MGRFCPVTGKHAGVMGTPTPSAGTAQAVGAIGACFKLVTFEPHLPTYEMMVGDFIRVGQEYREIGAFVQDTTSGNYSAAYVTSRFNTGYGAGSLAFRANAAQVLKSALTNMDNGAVTSATVAKRVGGTQLKAFFEVTNTNSDGTVFKFEDAADAAVSVADLCVGDILATNNYAASDTASQVMGSQNYMYQIENLVSSLGSVATASGSVGASAVSVGPPNSFVQGVLKSGEVPPTFWIKRGCALLLSNALCRNKN